MASARDELGPRSRTRTPKLLLALGATLTIGLLVLVGVLSSRSFRQAERVATDYLRAEKLSGEIVYQDEVLTMSARMAATTGDLAWVDRYNAAVESLDRALAEISALGRDGRFSLEGLDQTASANDVLLSIEQRAFDLIENGRVDEALLLLDDPAYQLAKTEYGQGITRLTGAIEDGISTGIAGNRSDLILATVLTAAAVIVALVIWFLLWRSLKSWERDTQASDRSRAHAEQSQRSALKRSEQVLQNLSANSPIDWWTIDADGRFTSHGGQDIDAFQLPSSGQGVAPPNFFDLMADHPEALAGINKALSGSAANQQLVVGEKTVQSVYLPITVDGDVSEVVGISTDVTLETDLARELQHQAEHDSLTGLLNRTGFERRVNARLATNHAGSAMIMLDMSGLRELNDLRGHEIGDSALSVAARRIESLAGSEALCARVGGDEFCVLVQGVDCDAIDRLASDLIDSLAEPIAAPDGELILTAFAGVDGPPLSGTTFRAVLPALDVSLNEARRRGRNSVSRFSPSMIADFAARVSLTREIEDAIAERQFTVAYQPVWDARTGRIIGAEALARWTHPVRGPISPAEFIPRASSAGLVGEIDALIVDLACRDLGSWRKDHREMSAMRMSVNLSAENLANSELGDRIDGLCAVYGVNPNHLLFEITETAAVENLGVAQQSLRHLRELGCRVALDDFGTGYSSLSQLQNLSVDVLKVDRSFVSGDVSVNQHELCEMIVGLAKVLQLRVVAEGVETEAQLDLMRDLGCDFVQGYLLARPMAGPDFASLVLDMHERSHAAFHLAASVD